MKSKSSKIILRPHPGISAEESRAARKRALIYLIRRRIQHEAEAAEDDGGGYPRKEIHEHNSGTPSLP